MSQDGETFTTTDHGAILHWAEARGGKPCTVKGTAKKGEDAGVLRLDFPGYSGEDSLEVINWQDFFEKFEASNLAFLHQERTKSGELSNFHKFIERDAR